MFNTFTQELPVVSVTIGYGCGSCITFDPSANCDAFRAKLVTPN